MQQAVSEFRRTGEHHVSLPDSDRAANLFVVEHGLAPLAKSLGRISTALGMTPIDVMGLMFPEGLTIEGSPAEPAKKPAAELAKKKKPAALAKKPAAPRRPPEPQYHNRKGKPITAARHYGGKIAWDTRRAIDQMMRANARLNRSGALALYRDEHPRSRAEQHTGPRKNGTKGQKSWDTKIQMQVDLAASNGEKIDWQEGHHRALAKLQEAARAKMQEAAVENLQAA